MDRVALLCLHTCPLAPPGTGKAGGMNVYVLNLAKTLGRLGLPVDVFTRCHRGHPPGVAALAEGVRLVHVAAGPPGETLNPEELHPHIPAFVQGVVGFERQEGARYHLVHSHYWLSAWAGDHLARRWGVPHVVTFHTLGEVKRRARVGQVESELRLRIEQEVAARASGITVFTPQERDALVRLYGTPRDRVSIVPGGVNLSLFRPIPQPVARHHLGLGDGRVVLYVGRMDPLKGVDILLRTLGVMEVPGGVRVLVVGGNPRTDGEMGRLERLVVDLKMGDSVEFVGTVEHQRLPLYYSAADVCVVPSYYESFGLVALEAMACGTPVVASRVGGLQALVRHGSTGYLVPWHCPEPFAQCLEALLANDHLRRAMGRAAREWASTMEWETVATATIQLYQALSAADPVKVMGGPGDDGHRPAGMAWPLATAAPSN